MINKLLLLKYIILLLGFIDLRESFVSDKALLVACLIIVVLLQYSWFTSKEKLNSAINLALLLGTSVYILINWQLCPIYLIALVLFELLQKLPKISNYVTSAIYLFSVSMLILPEGFKSWLILIALFALFIVIYLLDKENSNYIELIYEYQNKEAELKASSKNLENSLLNVKEIYTLQERNRLARDIHDSVGHALSTIIIQLEAISALSENDSPAASKMSANLRDFAKNSLDEVRSTIRKIKPKNFQKYEFIEHINNLINNYQESSPISVHFNSNKPLWAFNEVQHEFLYRAIQEFLSNASKYSKAEEIRLNLFYNVDSIILNMRDNGVGSDSFEEGVGLRSLRERALLNRARLSIQTAAGEGFKIRIVMQKGNK